MKTLRAILNISATDVENPMVNDDCWPDYESFEDKWEQFCRKADEEYDERYDSYYDFSRREDGYHF